MSLPNPAMDFTAFDVLTADQLDDLVENDQALAAGTGLNTNAVPGAALATNAIKLGYSQITSNFDTVSTSPVLVTGLSSTVTIPAGGRSLEITVFSYFVQNNVALHLSLVSLWDGTVGSGTQIGGANIYAINNSTGSSVCMVTHVNAPAAGSKTYNVGFASDSGAATARINAAASAPAFILVKLI